MVQPKSRWQRFNPRANQSHRLWLILGIIFFIGSVLGITFAIVESRRLVNKRGTVVRIRAGVRTETPGDIRIVWGYDSDNNVLGSSALDSTIGRDWTAVIEIDQTINHTARARYLDIIAGDNPICISAITITFPDDFFRVWTGDIGAACGYSWQWNSIANTLMDGSTGVRCVWMSATGAKGIGHDTSGLPILKQMKIDAMAYNESTPPDIIMNNPDYFCGSTVFSTQDQQPIVGIPQNNTSTPSTNKDDEGAAPTKASSSQGT